MKVEMKELFSLDELNELEMLEVKGGINDSQINQNGYHNNYVTGCACEIIVQPSIVV